MTLSDLLTSLRHIQERLGESDAKLVALLVDQIELWPGQDATPSELVDHLQRVLGNIWLTDGTAHRDVQRLLEKFQAEVGWLPGMTMNERLFNFDLMGRWDQADRTEQLRIRRKLEAPE